MMDSARLSSLDIAGSLAAYGIREFPVAERAKQATPKATLSEPMVSVLILGPANQLLHYR